MNSSVITRARVHRRQQRLDESANSALELAARRRQEQTRAAVAAAQTVCAQIDAIKAQSTEQIVEDVFGVPPKDITYRHGPQTPATLPAPPVVHFVDAQTVLTARLIAISMGALISFIAGVAVGKAL